MFNINDTVVYVGEGVCKIVGIEEKEFLGKNRTYYVLSPVGNTCSVCYVPTDNETVLSKIRKILSKEEIHALIDSMPGESAYWIENENERREQYKRVVTGGDHAELIKMIKAIFLKKKEREANGKRLHIADERILKEAEQLLHSEFQYVLNLNENELMSYIFDRLENTVS